MYLMPPPLPPEDAVPLDPGEGLLVRVASLHGPALLRYLRRKAGSDDEAQDLLQETYLRLAKSHGDEAVLFPQALAFRVAESVAADYRRRRATHRSHAHVSFDEAGCIPVDGTQERAVAAEQELQLLIRALGELSPKCRQVFFMIRMHHLRRRDVAERLGLSVKMVDKYLGQAMAHCRQRLGGLYALDGVPS